MIEYKCDICKEKKDKKETRTVVIHARDRNVYINRPVLNPNRKKHGTRLVCTKCLKEIFDYEE